MSSTTSADSVRTNYPIPSTTRIPSHIIIRPAEEGDCDAIGTCYWTAWGPSHLFWSTKFPAEIFSPWFTEAFRKEFKPDTAYVSFVAVDTTIKPDDSPENKALPLWEQKGANVRDGRLVSFTRWRVPQEDGNLDEEWPELPEKGLDMEIMGVFFGGMEHNHTGMMGKRPHWFLQMLGTETEWQKKGLGRTFVEWGCERADEDGLECYVDASDLGAPLYKKNGFGESTVIDIPDKEEYGHVDYVSLRRPKRSVSG